MTPAGNAWFVVPGSPGHARKRCRAPGNTQRAAGWKPGLQTPPIPGHFLLLQRPHTHRPTIPFCARANRVVVASISMAATPSLKPVFLFDLGVRAQTDGRSGLPAWGQGPSGARLVGVWRPPAKVVLPGVHRIERRHLQKIRVGRAVEDFAKLVKPRAVAGTIPCLLGMVPRHNPAQVRRTRPSTRASCPPRRSRQRFYAGRARTTAPPPRKTEASSRTSPWVSHSPYWTAMLTAVAGKPRRRAHRLSRRLVEPRPCVVAALDQIRDQFAGNRAIGHAVPGEPGRHIHIAVVHWISPNERQPVARLQHLA